MAILKTLSPIGRITGRLGDVVFRIRDNKTYVCRRPRSFTPGTDIESVQRRLRFKTTAMISKSVLKLDYIREGWKHRKKYMSVYNAIFQRNYPSISHDDISDSVSFHPDLGEDVIHELTKFDDSGFAVKVDFDVSLLHRKTKYIQMGAVLFCKNPLIDCIQDYKFYEFNSKPLPYGDDMILEIKYYDFVKQIVAEYTDHKLFVVFNLLNADKELINYSGTYRLV